MTTTRSSPTARGATLELEADHRRHAEVEPTICDLKHGAGLEHLPSGRFGANAAWVALVGIAYNLARWTGRLGVGELRMSPKTLRVRYLALPGRLTVSARRPHPAPARPLAVAVAVPVRVGPAALHPPPHLTDAGPRPSQDAPLVRPGRVAACTDSARTATATPTWAACALYRPARRPPQPILGPSEAQHARDHSSQSARRWNQD